MSKMVEPSQFECAICQNLLLDPVVGPCGHDFCKSCLLRWRTVSTRSSTVTCPLCREPIPCELGVCLRLQETIQLLFPEKARERRSEFQERKPVVSVSGNANTSAAQQAGSDPSSRQSTVLPRTPSSGGMAYAFSPPMHSPRIMGRQANRYGVTGPATVPSPAAVPSLAATVALQLPSDTWVPPATLCFTLGWHDPAETRGRRSLGRRRRAMAV